MGQGGWQAGAAGKVFAGTHASPGAEIAKMPEKLNLTHNPYKTRVIFANNHVKMNENKKILQKWVAIYFWRAIMAS